MPASTQLDALLERQRGVLKLAPASARRFYPDAGRLTGRKPGATFLPKYKMWVPERWIASTTQAANHPPIAGEGLSFLAGSNLSLRNALLAQGERLLGARRYAAHGPEFRVLIKILDGACPSFFTFMPPTRRCRHGAICSPGIGLARTKPTTFSIARKVDAPTRMLGCCRERLREELKAAVEAGSDALLKRSPVFLQAQEKDSTCRRAWCIAPGRR